MSLDKSIKHGKALRRPYRGSARVDRTCRPGGSCPRCQGNRTIGFRRLLQGDAPRGGTDQ